MKTSQQPNLVSALSGFICFLILLFVSLSCTEPTSEIGDIPSPPKTPQNHQNKKVEPTPVPKQTNGGRSNR
ncbi:MAG TPA: hypothetical protein VK892_16690 [Pyrinomonadaceae bacterium]|nr:hypothetical protein [Pyrinomonadaceae bacterium]